MRRFFLASLTLVAGIFYVGVYHATEVTPASREQAAPPNTPAPADAFSLGIWCGRDRTCPDDGGQERSSAGEESGSDESERGTYDDDADN